MAGLPRSIIKKYGVSKKAWAVFRGGKTTSRAKSGGRGRMARRKYTRRSSGGGFGGDMLGNALKGMGAAAAAKRFIGAPLGAFTGAAAGYLISKNLYGALGGYVHDNIGNVGGASSSSSGNYLN